MFAIGIVVVSVLFAYQIFLAVLACKNKLEVTPRKTLLETVRSESQSSITISTRLMACPSKFRPENEDFLGPNGGL